MILISITDIWIFFSDIIIIFSVPNLILKFNRLIIIHIRRVSFFISFISIADIVLIVRLISIKTTIFFPTFSIISFCQATISGDAWHFIPIAFVFRIDSVGYIGLWWRYWVIIYFLLFRIHFSIGAHMVDTFIQARRLTMQLNKIYYVGFERRGRRY